jgi:chitinase
MVIRHTNIENNREYPATSDRSGSPADLKNYVTFLKKLRQALNSSGYLLGLSITLPSSYWYMQDFDIVSIDPIVDWFNVMTYDLHGTWDSNDPFIGAVALAHTNLTEIKQSLDLLWRNNIDPARVNLGLGFYGRSTNSNPFLFLYSF